MSELPESWVLFLYHGPQHRALESPVHLWLPHDPETSLREGSWFPICKWYNETPFVEGVCVRERDTHTLEAGR